MAQMLLNSDPNPIDPNPVLSDEGKLVPSHICQKYVIHWQKTCSGCQLNFKFCTQLNHLFSRKKPQNNFFNWGPDHCENGI